MASDLNLNFKVFHEHWYLGKYNVVEVLLTVLDYVQFQMLASGLWSQNFQT